MEVIHNKTLLRESLAPARASRRVVLVPTMGALHDGHRACINLAREIPNAFVVATIFVNQAQFGPGEDFDAYPRDLDTDLERCREWGVDAVFTPTHDEIYSELQTIWVDVGSIAAPLCGKTRPNHFRGVATVVAKFFNIVAPDVAVFGQKDAQQALVIRALSRQLGFAVDLRLARTVREPDGLALSSRNIHLKGEQRPQAAAIFRGFDAAGAQVRGGERDARVVEQTVQDVLARGGIGEVEYAEVRNAIDLSALEQIEGRVILAVAARVGTTRIIDNVVFRTTGGTVEWDIDLY